jgi:hypothetical protein
LYRQIWLENTKNASFHYASRCSSQYDFRYDFRAVFNRGEKTVTDFKVYGQDKNTGKRMFDWCIRRVGINFVDITISGVQDFENFCSFMLETCTKLEKLSLVFIKYKDEENLLFKLISKENLKSIHIYHSTLDNNAFENVDTLTSLTPRVTHLKLESVTSAKDVVPTNVTRCQEYLWLCKHLAPTLQFFCFSFINITLRTLAEGFPYMENVKSLTLDAGYDSISLVDETLLRMSLSLKSIESLCLTGYVKITSKGVNYLLRSPCRRTLRFLNLDGCTSVDNNILKELNSRPSDLPMLTIFAYETGVTEKFEQYESANCSWKIEIDDSNERNMFFGSLYFSGKVDDDDSSIEITDDSD